MKCVTAVGYPRLNWTLIDMAGASRRMFGSFGIAIKYHPTVAKAMESRDFNVCATGNIEERTKNNLLAAFQRAKMRGLNINCNLFVHADVRQHTGLGSSTQVILSSLDAANHLNGWNLSPEEILDISGRGRTTQIGYLTHYYGGFCIDGGQAYSNNSKYLCSHTPGERKPVVSIGSWSFPDEWKISLVGEDMPVAVNPNNEDSWIQSNTPLGKSSAIETIVELYHGVLPAVLEKDYAVFSASMNNIQQVGWNSVVMKMLTKSSLDVLDDLWNNNYATAVSSLGPLITVIHTVDRTDDVKTICQRHDMYYSGPYDTLQKFDSLHGMNPFIAE